MQQQFKLQTLQTYMMLRNHVQRARCNYTFARAANFSPSQTLMYLRRNEDAGCREMKSTIAVYAESPTQFP